MAAMPPTTPPTIAPTDDVEEEEVEEVEEVLPHPLAAEATAVPIASVVAVDGKVPEKKMYAACV